MRRAALVCVVVGLLAGAGWVLLVLASPEVMPSYLAAWLFWMAVPLGALPLVLTLECFGGMRWAVMPALRRALLLLPLGALFAIPVLLRTEPLYRRAGVRDPLPDAWMAPSFFITRTVVILVVLSLLALLFSFAPSRGPRRPLAAIGLFVHVCLVSVAAVDWVLSLQPGLGSSAFGLLLIASQVGVAGCLIAFVIAVGTPGGAVPAELGLLLTVLLGVWAFLHFVQFLVVWSANLPAEIVWYQARTPGFGGAVVWFAVIAVAAGLAILPTGLARVSAILASFAAMLLLMHLAETLWLVTPAFRGHFTVTLGDGLAVLGIGGLLVAVLLALLPRPTEGEHHATA